MEHSSTALRPPSLRLSINEARIRGSVVRIQSQPDAVLIILFTERANERRTYRHDFRVRVDQGSEHYTKAATVCQGNFLLIRGPVLPDAAIAPVELEILSGPTETSENWVHVQGLVAEIKYDTRGVSFHIKTSVPFRGEILSKTHVVRVQRENKLFERAAKVNVDHLLGAYGPVGLDNIIFPKLFHDFKQYHQQHLMTPSSSNHLPAAES